MLHQASCKCGSIRLQVEGDPLWSGYCHCADCRKATGAPVSAFVIFKKSDVQWRGETPKQHRPNEKVVRMFCGTCGSPLSYETSDRSESVDLYTGLFDDAASLAPKEHIWESEKLPWLHIADDLPRREGV